MASRNRRIQLIAAGRWGPIVEWALGQMTRAFEARQFVVDHVDDSAANPAIIVGLVNCQQVDAALVGTGIAVPDPSESFVIGRLDQQRLLVAGRDERGLSYALTEIADAVDTRAADDDPFAGIDSAVESPALAWRGMQVFVNNAALEAQWYYDQAFWLEYFSQLARHRYNTFSLSMGFQNSHMSPPYPFHVDLPEFPQVRVKDLTAQQRQRNLKTLCFIAQTAKERGLRFCLAIWIQGQTHFVEPYVQGLEDFEVRRDANALGLGRLLRACPAIDAVQFLVNSESGVSQQRQLEYWQAQFHAIADCGRPVRLILRAKGLTDSTIKRARQIVTDTVISTKFWCEHMAMPYVMPSVLQDTLASYGGYRRYGPWDLLAKDRDVPMHYRLWTAGSQRLLLWGDPTWVQRFVRSCQWGGDGFEVMAPLTNKGGRNQSAQPWRIITDSSYQPFKHEYQRYWLFYLLFGRLGYNPDTQPQVWQRHLRHRFGNCGEAVGRGYAASGQIMPLLTTILQWSASSVEFWPEMFAGRTLAEDALIEPSDPTQFYGVAEFVEAALGNRLRGKWTPMRTAQWLEEIAGQTDTAIAQIESTGVDQQAAELRGTVLDFRILSGMARYHAKRLIACMHLSFFLATREAGRLYAALEHLKLAREYWRLLSDVAEGVYHDAQVFSFGKPFVDYDGHWKDRLKIIDEDLVSLQAIWQGIAAENRTADYRHLLVETVDGPEVTITHRPIAQVEAEQGLTADITVNCREVVRQVCCYHRPALATMPFAQVAMRQIDAGRYEVTIDRDVIDRRYDLMAFFEVMFESGHGMRWPDWRDGAPYLVLQTGR